MRSDMDNTVLPANNTIFAFTPSCWASPPFGWYSLCLPTEGWPGWIDLGGWLDWDKFPTSGVEPWYGHPYSINRARHRVTLLIWPTSLPTAPNCHWNCGTVKFVYVCTKQTCSTTNHADKPVHVTRTALWIPWAWSSAPCSPHAVSCSSDNAHSSAAECRLLLSAHIPTHQFHVLGFI